MSYTGVPFTPPYSIGIGYSNGRVSVRTIQSHTV